MLYRSTRKSVFSVKYQVIWCPKYRRDVLRGPIEARLKQIIGEVAAEFGGLVIEVETMPDGSRQVFRPHCGHQFGTHHF